MNHKIRVYLIDDHAVLRAGVRLLINAENDMEVAGEAADGDEAVEKIGAVRPDVVILDISMPGSNGLEVLRQLQLLSPASRMLILTMHNDEGYLREALSGGASGYVLKQAADKELLSAVRVVYQGGTYLHREHTGILLERGSEQKAGLCRAVDNYERLSPREIEVLRLIAMGFTNKEAADRLYLSVKTVETYKARIMIKLGLSSRVDLVRIALEHGLME